MAAGEVRRRWVALVIGVVASVALGCSDDPVVQTGEWSISGLSEGTVTLTETGSGKSWTFTGDGEPRRDYREIAFPRTGEAWSFEVEVTGTSRMTCDVLRTSGRYEDAYNLDDYEIYVSMRCGVPVESLEFVDPGLAACVEDEFEALVASAPGLFPNFNCYPRDASDCDTRDMGWLDCSDRGITDLTGIEWLHALYGVDLSHNALDRLDWFDDGANENISTLDVSHNAFTHVDFDDLGFGVRELDLSHNAITTVANAHSRYLTRLSLRHNELEAFDVAPLTPGYWPAEIVHLDLGYNRLTELDLTSMASLPLIVDVTHNQLTELDLGRDEGVYLYLEPPRLQRVDASFNRLSTAPSSDPSRRSFELPEGAAVELDLSYNDFAEIPGDYVSEFTRELIVAGNAIEAIDLEGAEALEHLDVSSNALTSIDLSEAPALRWLDLADNALDEFDWPAGAVELATVDLSGNPLAALEACEAPYLSRLTAEDAGLSTFDLSGCPSIVSLELAGNGLSALDVTDNPALEATDLRDNPLTCGAIVHIETTLPGAELAYGPDACIP